MLTIKKVPTVVSNYQEDSSDQGKVEGCGRDCAGKCCLPGTNLPLYAFKKDGPCSTENEEHPRMCFLHNLLLGQWDDKMSRGLFRYDVTTRETKVLPGQYGFVAQLNEGRHLKKRPSEFRVDQVLQPFDEKKFNFNKIGQEELLFRFQPSDDDQIHFFPRAPVTDHDSNSPNFIAINTIDRQSFLLALHLAKEAADPYFRIGYNSLGAFAATNHLHFQAYYLAVPFPVDKTPTIRIMTAKGGVVVSQLLNYPVRGFIFERGNRMKDLSDSVASFCILLQNKNIPHNVLITNCGKRIFLFPQCYAEKQALGKVSQELLDTQVNPVVWEISGHMVLKRRKDFEEVSDASAWRLLEEVSLSEERFQEVKVAMLQVNIGFREAKAAEIDTEEHAYDHVSPRAISHLPQDRLYGTTLKSIW